MGKILERTCVVCRTKKPKNELLRFVIKNGQVEFDKDQKDLGRGFYVCSRECWENAVSKKRKIKISSRESKFVIMPETKFEKIVGK